ncbi:uncharacterized protein LOC111817233 [Octodon degus]|uniref:Uncharacterized protein LOC111817233 n=1 Tax=Octodon degus TaxID=10160 RepID=A0A6P6EM46_OCTDE|nr:uncharacterized protein LOC111817233 [Octodon degus]
MEKDVAKIFDDILQQVSPEEPVGEALRKASMTAGPVTRADLDESHFWQSGLSNSELASSPAKQDEHLKKILDDILQQVSPEEPVGEALRKASVTAGPVTRADLDEIASVSGSSEEQEDLLDRLDQLLDDDHVSEKRARESSQVNKDVTAGAFRQAASPGGHPDLPCGPLLHFLRKNIIIAAGAVAAVFGVMLLLVSPLTSYLRRRQSVNPPANMTYNIFILDEKSWWQKPQESLTKFVEKHKQLK